MIIIFKYLVEIEVFEYYDDQEKRINILRWKGRTKSDTSGWVEYTKVIKRIISKELGKMTP